MSVQFNHTIVAARNQRESATFMADILGLPAPQPFFHFLVVKTANGVSLVQPGEKKNPFCVRPSWHIMAPYTQTTLPEE